MTARAISPVLLGACVGLLSMTAAAGEMLVQGRIVEVVPVTGPGAGIRPAADCHPVRPAPRDGLIELLQWDLRVHCAREPEINGYRVSYTWDGRTYQRLQPEPPAGDTISLRVRVH